MAKTRNVPSLRDLMRLRDVLHVRKNPNGGYILQAWPRKRGPPKDPNQAGPVEAFKIVQEGWRYLNDREKTQYIEETAGTGWYPRDAFLRACSGNLVQWRLKNGLLIRGSQDVTINISDELDVLGHTEGTILYRGPTGWKALPPGTANQVLTIDPTTHEPEWHDASGGGGTTGYPGLWPLPQPSVGNTAVFSPGFWGGRAFYPLTDFTANSVLFAVHTATAAATITPCVYADTGGGAPAALIAAGPSVTGATAGVNRLPLSASVLLTKDVRYWVGAIVQDASVTAQKLHNPDARYFATSSSVPPDPAPAVSTSTSGWDALMISP